MKRLYTLVLLVVGTVLVCANVIAMHSPRSPAPLACRSEMQA